MSPLIPILVSSDVSRTHNLGCSLFHWCKRTCRATKRAEDVQRAFSSPPCAFGPLHFCWSRDCALQILHGHSINASHARICRSSPSPSVCVRKNSEKTKQRNQYCSARIQCRVEVRPVTVTTTPSQSTWRTMPESRVNGGTVF